MIFLQDGEELNVGDSGNIDVNSGGSVGNGCAGGTVGELSSSSFLTIVSGVKTFIFDKLCITTKFVIKKTYSVTRLVILIVCMVSSCKPVTYTGLDHATSRKRERTHELFVAKFKNSGH